ncbi:MAG: carboxypeptidase regulatory-like domain-containing protein, partial [Gemmatimonadaceae bacterium]
MISPLRGRSSARRARDGRQIPLGTLVVLTLLLPARRSDAQSDQAGRVEGVVFDSVHARPFAGAHVVAVGTGAQTEVRREAVSDASGRYRIDSLPAGRYIVGFESALLDSLEVALSPREASVAPGQIATLDLALPSAAKLRSAVCLGAELPPGTGVIYGHVVNAETESPFAGVKLAMAWQDLTVDRTGKRLRPIKVNQSSSVVTDADGWYRMCGVPTGAWVSMQIQLDKRSGPVLRALVDDTLGITIRHLSLATGDWRASDTTAATPAAA